MNVRKCDLVLILKYNKIHLAADYQVFTYDVKYLYFKNRNGYL